MSDDERKARFVESMLRYNELGRLLPSEADFNN
jgi:hypothetical protein